MSKYYLAYGSNLNPSQMLFRCRDAKAVGTTVIPNQRLSFKGSVSGSYLTIGRSKNNQVPAVVWEISDRDEAALDRYEGFPVLYTKHTFKNLNVKKIGDGSEEVMDCFAYIMTNGRPYGMPTGNYYMTCVSGYRHFGLDESYIEEALDYTASKVKDSKVKELFNRFMKAEKKL